MLKSMNISSLLRDHVLYTLKDRGSGAVQGFAFVKKDQNNLSEVEFVPVDGDRIPGFEDGQIPHPVSDQSITCNNSDEEVKEVSFRPESTSSSPEPNNQRESTKDDMHTQADLNLSEASSTNETTLDECQSQSSKTSPHLIPKSSQKVSGNNEEDIPDMKPQVSLVSQDSVKSLSEGNSKSRSLLLNTNEVKTEEKQYENRIISLKSEIKESETSLSTSSWPLSSLTVASLAAEVISRLNSKPEGENNIVRNEKQKDSRPKSSIEEKLSPSNSEEIVESFERKRNAKKEMSREDYDKLSKPFQLGWKRECVVHGSQEITHVYYKTPPHFKAKRKSLKSSGDIKEYLKEVGETNITLGNFSMRRMFLGFESEFESVRIRKNYNSVSKGKQKSLDKTGWKYDHFFEVVSKDGDSSEKRVKCLLCGSLFKAKSNFGRHVKVYHEPDETCDKCGKEFRPINIQDHRARCKEKLKDLNENEVKSTEKRKGSTVSSDTPPKVMKTKDDYNYPNSVPTTISNTPKPVARKSSPPCPIITSPDKSEQVNKSFELESCSSDNIKKLYNPLIVPSHTVEIPSAIAVGDDTKALAASARYDTALNSADNKAKTTITFESNAPSKSTSVNQTMSNIGSGKDESNLVATLVMTSAEGTRVKMQVKVHAKLMKGMKKFGVRMGISHESLRFLLEGKELTGEELAGGLDGTNILVERRGY